MIIWSHVLYMQSETKQTKLEDPNLKDLDKFLDEKDSGIRLEAIQALGVLGEAARSRAVRLRSIAQGVEEDPAVINAAIYALAGMKSQKVSTLPVLERLRKHKNAVVVDTAEGAIALLTDTKREMKNDLVISSLLTIAGNKEAQPEAVIDAIWALSGMKVAFRQKPAGACAAQNQQGSEDKGCGGGSSLAIVGKDEPGGAEKGCREAIGIGSNH